MIVASIVTLSNYWMDFHEFGADIHGPQEMNPNDLRLGLEVVIPDVFLFPHKDRFQQH